MSLSGQLVRKVSGCMPCMTTSIPGAATLPRCAAIASAQAGRLSSTVKLWW